MINTDESNLGYLKNTEEGDAVNPLKKKVNIIADEVIKILKEASEENQKNISSALLVEKMSSKDAVVGVFANHGHDEVDIGENNNLKELMNGVLDRFSKLTPTIELDDFTLLKEQINTAKTSDFISWLDLAVQAIEEYIDTTSASNNELKESLKASVLSLEKIDEEITREFSSQQNKHEEDIEHDDNLSSAMNNIEESLEESDDIKSIKMAILSKTESINEGLKDKKQKDLLRIQEAEKNMRAMKTSMQEIKENADKAREKSQKLELASMYDTLTGVYNRKFYDLKTEECLANLKRHETPSALIVCDIDYFKKINDDLGHKAGDQVLKKLALLIKQRLRKSDFIARYGGDEFVIILQHCSLENAIKVGENIHNIINKSSISFKGSILPFSISGGISAFRKDDDANTVFERADKALYVAKKSGRNMIKTEQDD